MSEIGNLPGVGQSEGEEAASRLEAYFLRRMLAEMKAGQGMGGGFAGETFQEMLNTQLADTMAEAGGIGIAQVLVGQLSPGQLEAAPEAPQAASPLTMAPVAGAQSSNFGLRRDPIHGGTRFHAGIDVAAAKGTPVVATGNGVVKRAGKAGGYGNLVVVDHGGGVETRYAHLESIEVKAGQKLSAGARLGTVGATGRATGPHLHFEVREDGKPVDPKKKILGLNTPQVRSKQ